MFLCIEVLEEAYTGFHKEEWEKKNPSLKIQNNTEIADNTAFGKYPPTLFSTHNGKVNNKSRSQ